MITTTTTTMMMTMMMIMMMIFKIEISSWTKPFQCAPVAGLERERRIKSQGTPWDFYLASSELQVILHVGLKTLRVLESPSLWWFFLEVKSKSQIEIVESNLFGYWRKQFANNIAKLQVFFIIIRYKGWWAPRAGLSHLRGRLFNSTWTTRTLDRLRER